MPRRSSTCSRGTRGLRTADTQEIIGWENIELISDRDFDTWIDEFHQIKDKYPDAQCSSPRSWKSTAKMPGWRLSSAARRRAWMRSSCNFSCPHGLPERKMGAAMGENPEILEEVCGWVMGVGQNAGLGQDDAQRDAH